MSSNNRIPMIAGNWKMHLVSSEAAELATAIRKALPANLRHDVLLAPTFTNLHSVHEAIKDSPILLAAQDMAWEEKGAFTGAVSPAQIKDAGCTHVILGHSERRHIFLESDEMINKKVKTAIKDGIVPVLCIGELLEERESGKTNDVLAKQLDGDFAGITEEEASKVIIAYEPVWAIGTGKTATPEVAEETHQFIRSHMEKMYGKVFADSVRILYGGSVKATNVDQLMAQPDIDGALVGGESLKADKFPRVIDFQKI